MTLAFCTDEGLRLRTEYQIKSRVQYIISRFQITKVLSHDNDTTNTSAERRLLSGKLRVCFIDAGNTKAIPIESEGARMPKPHPLPTHKMKLRNEADDAIRLALEVLLELRPELGRDPRLARENEAVKYYLTN